MDAARTFAANPHINCLTLESLKRKGKFTNIYRSIRGGNIGEIKIGKVNIPAFLNKMDERAKEAALLNPPVMTMTDEFDTKPKILNTTTPKTRGRKRIDHNIVFPRGEFTIKSLAEKHQVKNHTISNEIHRLRALGEKFEIVKTIKTQTGRGKPTQVLKFIFKEEKKVIVVNKPKVNKIKVKVVKSNAKNKKKK